MKLYYTLGVSDIIDYEYDIPDDIVAEYLASITKFTADEILKSMSLFAKVFESQIYKHFESEAKSKFELLPELEGKRVIAWLEIKEKSKRNRQAFLKREALKKKEMM